MAKEKNNVGKLWFLAAGFAVLMSVPFLVPHTGILSLVAFVPLFFLDRILRENGAKHQWWYIFAAFLLFNIFSTFWIWWVSPVGSVATILLNSLFMAAIFAIYRWKPNKIFFIALWLAFEHFYFEIELSWPWLTLGNALATSPQLAQWYEIFGTVGGSAWILISNTLIFEALTAEEKRRKVWLTSLAAAFVFIPIICSEVRYATYKESTEDSMEVVVAQPNVDPFKKYGIVPQERLDSTLVRLFEEQMTPQTKYLVTPETFTFRIDIDDPLTNSSLLFYQEFLRKHPDTQLLLGALTYRTYQSAMKPTRSARELGQRYWLDNFNTAMVLDGDTIGDHYFKSKLVPGVEIIPYQNVLKFLGPLVQKFGGSPNSYGTMDEMIALEGADGRKVGAMICYESIYGDWSRNATLKGAEWLAVMTNDGWWGDTPGYHQHFRFAQLRAIENRRDVIHAANTGISGLINQRGEVVTHTGWWVETSFRCTVNRNSELTPFVRYGDFVGRGAVLALVLIVVGFIASSLKDRRSSRGKSASSRS